MKISEHFICENVTFNTGVIGTTTHSKLGANYEEYLPKKKKNFVWIIMILLEFLENFGRSQQKNVIFTKKNG